MHITGLVCVTGHIVVRITKHFMFEYVERFIYVHVTELGCIIGHNVICVTKHLCINMSNVCVHTCHRTRLHKIMWLYELCIHVCHRARWYCTTRGWVLKHLYVLGCIIGHVVWEIRHSNMYMSETRL